MKSDSVYNLRLPVIKVKKEFGFIFCLALVLSSCTTFHNAYPDYFLGPPSDFTAEWSALFSGVDLVEVHRSAPDLAVYCMRINLATPGVSVMITPGMLASSDSVGEEERCFYSMKTSTFVKKFHVQAAINATPFEPVTPFENRPVVLSGIEISDGKLLSLPAKKYAAVFFFDDGTARILTPVEIQTILTSGGSIAQIRLAAGGFALLLRDGEVRSDQFEGLYDSGRAPRTAIGISADGETVYFMVIDGKNRGHSVGATFSETASWIAAFGADSALMLDGGGSSTLAVANSDGSVRLLNVPVQGTIPGIERPVANHIGIYADK